MKIENCVQIAVILCYKIVLADAGLFVKLFYNGLRLCDVAEKTHLKLFAPIFSCGFRITKIKIKIK